MEIERKQQRALQRKEKYTSELMEYGLWQSIGGCLFDAHDENSKGHSTEIAATFLKEHATVGAP